MKTKKPPITKRGAQPHLKPNETSGPHTIDRATWFYAEEKRLTVVHEIHNDWGYQGTVQVHIPWGKVLAVAPTPKSKGAK